MTLMFTSQSVLLFADDATKIIMIRDPNTKVRFKSTSAGFI